MATKRLYVGNLPFDAREEDVRNLFAPYGPVTGVEIIGGRGFGFVDVPAERAAEAIGALNGTQQGGRALVVSEARPRPEFRSGDRGGDRRPGGGGGFRSGDGGRGHSGRGPGGGGGRRGGGRGGRRERHRF